MVDTKSVDIPDLQNPSFDLRPRSVFSDINN